VPAYSNKWTPFLLAVILGVLVWNHYRGPDRVPPPETQHPLPKVATSPPPAPVETAPPLVADVIPAPPDVPATPDGVPPAPATTRVLPGSVAGIPTAPEEDIDISEDLGAVDSAIRDFQAVHGENPVGSNAEITTALFINNPRQIRLEIPAGSHVNADGELCDRWGTPYFFHQVSATEMEIRSAGPDRKMWTGDDSQM
jgi:hypothetical protein